MQRATGLRTSAPARLTAPGHVAARARPERWDPLADVLASAVAQRSAATDAPRLARWPALEAPLLQYLPADLPSEGTPVDAIGVVDWDGTPELRLRATPTTEADNVIGYLPFSTRLQVIKRFAGKWYFVSTSDGRMGYVASRHVRTDLPEPGATRHRVRAGVKGYAISIAEAYYKGGYRDVRWGQDLRFYVNVLAWANGTEVPDTVEGWKDVRFQAGEKIWVPSKNFAKSLKGQLNSGSISYEALDALGLAGFVERIDELLDDFRTAVGRSKDYLGDAIRRHVTAALINVVSSLAVAMVGAIAIMGIFTAAGAAIGGILTGGAGTALGAEAGFELSLVFLEWLGIGFLIKWIVDAVTETAAAFGRFLSSVWDARGDEDKLDLSGKDFAEAVATLIGNLLEALALWAASVGMNAAIAKLRESRFGRSLGEALVRWLSERAPTTLQERVVQNVLKDAIPGKVSSSRQFEKPGGAARAQADFAALEPTGVTTRPGGVQTGSLADGSTVIVRPTSSSGAPTLEIQPLRGRGKPIKIRYP